MKCCEEVAGHYYHEEEQNKTTDHPGDQERRNIEQVLRLKIDSRSFTFIRGSIPSKSGRPVFAVAFGLPLNELSLKYTLIRGPEIIYSRSAYNHATTTSVQTVVHPYVSPVRFDILRSLR